MFWTRALPEDALAGEAPALASARAQMMARVEQADLSETDLCQTMHALDQGWTTGSCGHGLPNTHWHLLCRESLWMAWRVDLALPRPERSPTSSSERWDHASLDQRRQHLRHATALSPMAVSLSDLVDEIARHGGGLGAHANSAPDAEIRALQLALGVAGEDGERIRFLAGLDGFRVARLLVEQRGAKFEPVLSNPLPR